MLLQQKKANSFVPAIFSPLHGLFRKKGGTGAGIRFSFPCISPNLASTRNAQMGVLNGGRFFHLQLELFLLTVKLLCLQSLKALIRRTFPL